jgi:IclR family pca regulon transcriptional regulator
MGKILLAYLPREQRAAVLAQLDLRQRGPNTLTARRRLVAELERVRDGGLAINNEELAYGLRSIAAPVFSQSGAVAAAINLAVHSSMVSMEELVQRLSGPLKRTAAEISVRIGYRADGAGNP